MALRRQNSEIIEQGSRVSREHKRYLSIGDISDGGDSAILEIEDVGKENSGTGRVSGDGKGEGLKGSRTVPVFGESGRVGVEKKWNGGTRMGSASSMSFYGGEENAFFGGR